MMEDTHLDKLLALFESKLSRPLRMYLETCSRCGICTPACHAYASAPKPEYTPAHRAEVVRKIYKMHFKRQGRVLPGYEEARALDEAALEDLYDAAYSCTGCRRCMVYCPFGIDTQQIMSIAKLLLIGADAQPEILTMLADVSISKGEGIEEMKPGFIEGLKRLEQDVIDKWRVAAGDVPIPTDVNGADLLYVALAGAHSIVPAAAVFNAAGENWTLSFFEAVNFGAFVGDPTKTRLILDRIVNEARRLGVREVCICECGTAFRVMKQLAADQPFSVSSITEVHARYIRDGRIKLDKRKFDQPATYHDPCQIARNGGVFEAPRYILSQLTGDFREMSKDPAYNWCCGGGGGLVALSDETYDFRMKSARVKADQVQETGAKVLATACENCHSQLGELMAHYGMDLEVKFLTAMVADALEQ